jgi:hypothetical protein
MEDMPNHITNRVEIKSAEIREAIAGDKDHPHIDFNKIIPMPEALKIESGSMGEMGVKAIMGKKYNYNPFMSHEETMRRWEKYSDEEKEKALELGRLYLRNYADHGHATWYDWCVEKWGTKWNAYSQKLEGDSIIFDTAWATPSLIWEALSKKYPDQKFTIKYADEDIGSNCGVLTYSVGTLVAEQDMSGDDDFAYQVKGWDKDEITETEEG